MEETVQLSALLHGVSSGSVWESVDFSSVHNPRAVEEMIHIMYIEHEERISKIGELVKVWCQGASPKPGTRDRMIWSQTKEESSSMLQKERRRPWRKLEQLIEEEQWHGCYDASDLASKV